MSRAALEQDERGLCRAFRQGAEAGRRKVPSAANTSTTSTPISRKRNAASGRSSRCATRSMTTPSRSSAPRYSAARISFLIALAGLIAVAAASAGLVMMVRRRVCKPIVDLTATDVAASPAAISQSDIAGAARGDEIGAMAAAVQVFKDNMIKAEQLAAEKEAESDNQDAARQRARRSHPRVRDQGQRTGRRIVVGFGRDGRHRAVDVIDGIRHQPPGRRRCRSLRTDIDQRADGCQRHRGIDLLDIRDRPSGRAIHRDRRARGRERPAHRRYRALAGRRRPEDRRRRHPDPEHRGADQSAGAERDHRGGARRRCRPRLCGGRLRSQIAGRPDRQGHNRNLRADRSDPGGERPDRDRDRQRRRGDRRDRPDRHRDCVRDRATGLGDQGDLAQRPGGRPRHPGSQRQHLRRPARRRRHRRRRHVRCWARPSSCRRSRRISPVRSTASSPRSGRRNAVPDAACADGQISVATSREAPAPGGRWTGGGPRSALRTCASAAPSATAR